VYGFLFAFHIYYGSNSHHFGDKASYWSKIALDAPVGGSRRNIAIMFGTEELEWLPDGENN